MQISKEHNIYNSSWTRNKQFITSGTSFLCSLFSDLAVFTDRQGHKNQKHISSSARCHSRSSHKHPRKCTNSKHIPACYLPTSSQFTQTARQMYKLQTHFNMLPSKIFASSIRDAQLRLKKKRMNHMVHCCYSPSLQLWSITSTHQLESNQSS